MGGGKRVRIVSESEDGAKRTAARNERYDIGSKWPICLH